MVKLQIIYDENKNNKECFYIESFCLFNDKISIKTINNSISFIITNDDYKNNELYEMLVQDKIKMITLNQYVGQSGRVLNDLIELECY